MGHSSFVYFGETGKLQSEPCIGQHSKKENKNTCACISVTTDSLKK
jgi:hypothetical protein